MHLQLMRSIIDTALLKCMIDVIDYLVSNSQCNLHLLVDGIADVGQADHDVHTLAAHLQINRRIMSDKGLRPCCAWTVLIPVERAML
jgi:hypothetical protein